MALPITSAGCFWPLGPACDEPGPESREALDDPAVYNLCYFPSCGRQSAAAPGPPDVVEANVALAALFREGTGETAMSRRRQMRGAVLVGTILVLGACVQQTERRPPKVTAENFCEVGLTALN